MLRQWGSDTSILLDSVAVATLKLCPYRNQTSKPKIHALGMTSTTSCWKMNLSWRSLRNAQFCNIASYCWFQTVFLKNGPKKRWVGYSTKHIGSIGLKLEHCVIREIGWDIFLQSKPLNLNKCPKFHANSLHAFEQYFQVLKKIS